MPLNPSVPLRMPPELEVEIEKAMESTGLNKQDIMRQAIQLGLPIFTRALDRAFSEARGETQDNKAA